MIEFTGSNFIGGEWENGFGLHFEKQPDETFSAAYTFYSLKEGPPGITHGGALAAVMDEVMTAAIFATGKPAFTVNLTIDYRLPVPIGTEVRIEGKIDRENGRKIYTSARIVRDDGIVLTEAKALFLSAP